MTCGSVDDGKSTLLGRLLFETGAVPIDQLAVLTRDSKKHLSETGQIDFSLLFDGLEDERRQAITIDVGYRHFSTERRSYIVADSPGHEQYTRNMATAASNADVAVILVDARKGILDQTRRHAALCSIFRIPNIIVCINKIDLVNYDQARFDVIASELQAYLGELSFNAVVTLPVSAAQGDNVTRVSNKMHWHSGGSLLAALEAVEIGAERLEAPLRFPVQWINRPYDGYRGLSGTIASGNISVGDSVVIFPSQVEARVKNISQFGADVESESADRATTILLDREVDVTRGDLIAHRSDVPVVSEDFAADLLWCSADKLVPGRQYSAKFINRTVLATVYELQSRLDIATLTGVKASFLSINEIGRCGIKVNAPVVIDTYRANRITGAFILIDRITKDTAAAGMVTEVIRSKNLSWQSSFISREDRAKAKGQQPVALWFTGFPGTGKSTIADLVERRLYERGHHTMMIDGDNIRQGINRNLAFSEEDRAENIRRAAEVAKLMVEAGLLALCCFITPSAKDRQMAKDIIGSEHFIEVFIDTPLEECIRRDPKGLYARAQRGEITDLTGIGSPYDVPVRPDVHIRTMDTSPQGAVDVVVAYLKDHKYI